MYIHKAFMASFHMSVREVLFTCTEHNRRHLEINDRSNFKIRQNPDAQLRLFVFSMRVFSFSIRKVLQGDQCVATERVKTQSIQEQHNIME